MDIEVVARLARIKLEPEASKRYAQELKGVLDLMETLGELDLSQVEPTRHVILTETPFREDRPGETLSREDALKNAPASDGESFIVPKVV